MSMMMMDIKNNKPVNWFSWQIQEILSLCDFYIEIGLCKKYENMLQQLEEFQLAILRIDENRENFLKKIMKASYSLKRHLMIHSVFDINSPKSNDWLVKFMINELQPTEEEIEEAHKKEEIPNWIKNSLSIFDPQPIGIEKYLDNVEIQYKMYGDWKKGEFYDPIIISDRYFRSCRKSMSDEELTETISSYETVSIN